MNNQDHEKQSGFLRQPPGDFKRRNAVKPLIAVVGLIIIAVVLAVTIVNNNKGANNITPRTEVTTTDTVIENGDNIFSQKNAKQIKAADSDLAIGEDTPADVGYPPKNKLPDEIKPSFDSDD